MDKTEVEAGSRLMSNLYGNIKPRDNVGYEAIKKLNVRQSGYISNIRDDVEDNKKRWRPRYNILLRNFSLAHSRLLRSGIGIPRCRYKVFSSGEIV